MEVEEERSPKDEEAEEEVDALSGPKLEKVVDETLGLREWGAEEEGLVDIPALLPDTEFLVCLVNEEVVSSIGSSLNIPLWPRTCLPLLLLLLLAPLPVDVEVAAAKDVVVAGALDGGAGAMNWLWSCMSSL